jgi:HSP20 family protein
MEDKAMLPNVLSRKNSTVPRNFVDEFFNDNFLPRFFDWGTNWTNTNVPAVNVEETEKEYVIDVAAPGLDKKDFKVSLDENVLTISSQKEQSSEEKKEGYLRREFNYSTFSRSFTLPEDTDASQINAVHKNGVLSIAIPKHEAKAKVSKEIKIS